MIACLHVNGLVFLVPGLLIGGLLALVIILRSFWLAEREVNDQLAGVLNDQFKVMDQYSIRWDWWDNYDPWYPESATITQEEQ